MNMTLATIDPPAAPVPAFTGVEMAKALRAYRELQKALDQGLPDAMIVIEGKAFRRKQYWKAVATAFQLNVELCHEERVVHGSFSDGRENFGYLVTYRAVSPSGRRAVGDGACFALEKARSTSVADRWRELPRGASEHNVRSHAHTRASNRAISNLVAFGEVSFEELDREQDGHLSPDPEALGPPPVPESARYVPDPVNPKRRPDQEPLSEAQRRKIFAEVKRVGWEREQFKAFVREAFGVESTSELRTGDLDDVLRLIRKGPPPPGGGAE